MKMCISLSFICRDPPPLVPFMRMYCLSHSKCTIIFIFPLGLLKHTQAHRNREIGISQGMLTSIFTFSTVCFGFNHSLKPEMTTTRLKDTVELNIFILCGDLCAFPMCLLCFNKKKRKCPLCFFVCGHTRTNTSS